MADVFVSYSRRDGEFVARLTVALEERGKSAWVDVEGIRDAEVFPEALRRAIEASDALVFVISPDSVHSSFCEEEVVHAASLNKRIVPLSLRPVPDEEVPGEVRFRSWIPAGGDGGFEAMVNRLVTALDTDVDWERQHSRLTVKALEWDESGRDRSFQLRGAELRSAEAWLAAGADKEPGPTALEAEYLAAGRRAATRRQRGVVVASLLVAAVSVGLLIFALISRSAAVSQALTSDAERVGAQALGEKNLDLAMLYTVAGVKLENRPQTRSDLLATLQNNPDAIRVLRPSSNEIEALAVSPTGRLLASGDSAGVVRFENISRWVSGGAAVHVGGVILQHGIAFSPHHAMLGVLTEQSSPHTPTGPVESGRTNLYVIDTATRKPHLLGSWHIPTPVVPYPGPSFAYSPDGRDIALAIASAGPGGSIRGDTLRLLDASTGRLVWQRSYPIKPGQLSVSLRFAPDGTLIGTGQQGQTLLWNVHTGRVVRRFPIGGEPAVSAEGHTVALAVNSPSIAAASSKIAVIDLRTGHHRFLPAELSTAWVNTLAMTPDGTSVVGATVHGDTSVWDTASGLISQTIAAPVGAVGIAALDPAGRTVLVGSRDGSVTAFDLSGARRLGRAFRWNTPDQSCISAPCFAVDRHSEVMAATQGDGSVALVDLHTLRKTATLPARNGSFAPAIAFFPDGRALLTGGSAGRITLWDVRSHRVLRTIEVGAPIMGGAVSPHGRLIAVQTQAPGSTGSLVEVRPATGGRPIWTAHVQDGASGVSFSPNGREIAALGCCTSLSTVISWDARSGRQLFDRRLSNHATAIAYAADSRTLAVGTENGQALSWRARRGTQAAPPLHAASASVAAMSFSPDSRLLAVSSTDESTTLWNIQSRKQLGGSFPSRPNVITVPVFEPNGRLLIEYLADAAEWPLDVRAWQRFACQVAGRNLTLAEWRAILPNRPYTRVCPAAQG